MFIKVKFFLARAWLAGLFTKLPIGLILLIFGISLTVDSCSNLTPYSVNVSGYYRSNGTYIHAYDRRPAGGVSHDAPLKENIFFGILISVFGGGLGTLSVARARSKPFSLIPAGTKEFPDPHRPFIRTIIVPSETSIARKNWRCERCGISISVGSKYNYFTVRRGRMETRHRYCDGCRLKLEGDKFRNELEEQNHRLRLQEVFLRRLEWRKAIAKKYYGESYEDWQMK